ncbi:MAG TPA: hypothetical protein ENH82_17640, partial [bacterium]|nr:hypothetical protein [bacterium]
MNKLKNSIKTIILLLLSGYVFLFIIGYADHPPVNLEPGSIFREYKWNGPWINAGKWQRITDPNASHPGAQQFLPNPTNFINIDDLEYAVKAEIYIEMLQCHAGTHNKRIRINGKEWLKIPEAVSIPGGNPECYQTMTYPTVEVPLTIFKTNENKFELNTFGQKCYDFGWGQFLIYGVTFRIYYSELKTHPTGEITSPAPGSSIGENPTVTAAASGPDGIKQIDFIGYYEDFNYEGDNIWNRWHYNYHYGNIQHHLGTVFEAPYSITWETGWVPDQAFPGTGCPFFRNKIRFIQLYRPVIPDKLNILNSRS